MWKSSKQVARPVWRYFSVRLMAVSCTSFELLFYRHRSPSMYQVCNYRAPLPVKSGMYPVVATSPPSSIHSAPPRLKPKPIPGSTEKTQPSKQRHRSTAVSYTSHQSVGSVVPSSNQIARNETASWRAAKNDGITRVCSRRTKTYAQTKKTASHRTAHSTSTPAN